MFVPTSLFTREQLLDHFTALVAEFETPKILRLNGWLEDILAGIETLKGASGTWAMSTRRQLFITTGGTTYKVRFNHNATFKGAIELVEMHGNADGPIGRPISTAADAQEFAQHPDRFLPGYVHKPPPAPKPAEPAEPDQLQQAVNIISAARTFVETQRAYRDAFKNLAQAVAQFDKAVSTVTANSPTVGQA